MKPALIALLLLIPVTALGQARTAEQIVSVPFSRLNENNPPDGSVRTLINGTPGSTPCTAGSVKVLAIKLNGVWQCPNLGAGAGTGDVTGPASATVGEIATYSSTTGKVVGRSNTLNGIALLSSGVLSTLTTTGTGSVVRSDGASITGVDASAIFSSGTIPPARIISNALTPNTCLRLSAAGAIETAAADCGSGGGGGTPGGVTGNLQYNDAGVLAGLLNSSYSSVTGTLTFSQQANGNDTLVGLRATDTSPTGTWLRLRNAANTTDLFSVTTSGQVFSASSLLVKTIAAPSTPAAGNTILWTDITDKNLKAQDDAGNVSVTVRAIACSGTDKISSISSAGVVTCTADQGGAGTGVITLNTLNTSDQNFVPVDDTNIDLSISSSVSTHTFTVAWAGTLAKARQHAASVYTDQANTWSAGAQSFAGATSLMVPTSAGVAPSTSAQIAYDSTSNTWEVGVNGTNRTLAFTAGSQTFTDKTLDNSTTANLRDTLLTLQDNADPTKTVNFELGGITSGQNRVVTIADAASVTVQPSTATTNQWVTHIDSAGVQQKAQPSFANISGTMSEIQGGTGQTAWAQGDLPYAITTNTLARLPKSTSATRYLSNTGASNNPAWAQVDLTNGVTGVLPKANQHAATVYTDQANAFGAFTQTVAGSVVIGHTTTLGRLGQTLDVVTSANFGGIAVSSFTTTAVEAPLIDLNRSKSATKGTMTVVASGDLLGALSFRGADGTDFEYGAQITGTVDGTPGNNDMPGRLSFFTTADGSATLSERWRINSAGHFLAGTDNTYDIGASGATRPRAGYFGTSVTTPSLLIPGSSSGVVTVTAAAAAGTWSMTLPTTAGTTGQFLQTNGSGVTVWATPAGAGDMTLAAAQSVTGAKTFTDGTLILNGGDYGASDGSLPGSPVEKAFYLNTNTSSRRLFIYNNAAYREIFQSGLSGPISVPNGGTGLASGTSGGIPYFSSSTTMASSAALTANLPVIGGGAGAAPSVGTRSGNTTAFVTTTGTLTSGRCAEWDANGNLIQAAAACGSGGGSGTINSGVTNTIPKYTASTTLDDSLLTDDGTTLTYTGTGGFSLSSSVAGHVELAEGTLPTVAANRLTLTAPTDAPAGGLLYVLPSDTPTNGEQLTANISGTTVTLSWDAAGSGGSGDAVSVNGSAATDANFINTTASGTVPSITWAINTGATPDEVSISAIGPVSLTEAGVLTTGTQGIAGIKILGHSTALGRLGQTFEITTSANYGGMALNTFSTTSAEAGTIDFNRSKSATKGTHTIIGAEDSLGHIDFRGSDGTDFEIGASIVGVVDGTPGNNDMPGRLSFFTTPDASATAVERWRINNAGHFLAATDNAVDIGASGATRPRSIYAATSVVTPNVTWATSVIDLAGSGTPEGAVTAAVGSVYRRTNGGAATTLYVKESGAGNTGWVAVGGGGGSGTINSGATNTIPKYTASTTIDDSLLSDDGTNLIYGGSGQGSLGLKDSDASHYQTLQFGSNITADRIFTITTGDAARTLSMSGNVTTAADFITSGANSLTLTTTGSTNVTLPTTGTLATLTDLASGTATFTNKAYDTSATGNVFTSTFIVEAPAAGCNGTTASSFWDLPTTTPAVAACVTGTNTQKAYLDFADTSGGFSAQYNFRLAADFTGTIDAHITWLTTATSGNVEWSLSTICVATDATETDDPAFNSASTVVTAAPGVASRLQTSTITSVTITGCAAGEWIYAKIFRDGNDAQDTLSATARLKGVQFVLRRAQ